MREIDTAKYTEELARLMDVLIVRYNSENGRNPSGYVRSKLRDQVISFLADRYPMETAIYREYLEWMFATLKGDFRTVRNDEVPAQYKVGCDISNSLRGKLSAQARYRNAGIAAFRGDRTGAEERKYQEREDTLNDATIFMSVSPSLQAIRGETKNAFDREIADTRYSLAIDYCSKKEALFPSDEVAGLMMGMSTEESESKRQTYAARYIFEQSHHGGWWIQPVPEKTLMEKIMDKLGTLPREELESLADLLKDIG